MTSSWFFLSTLNYDARSTTHQRQVNSSCASVLSSGLVETQGQHFGSLVIIRYFENNIYVFESTVFN